MLNSKPLSWQVQTITLNFKSFLKGGNVKYPTSDTQYILKPSGTSASVRCGWFSLNNAVRSKCLASLNAMVSAAEPDGAVTRHRAAGSLVTI